MKLARWTSAARNITPRVSATHYKKTGRKSADQARPEAPKASAGRIQEEKALYRALEAS